jgi:ADP-L-glycero-D-manno-heptose 6-epimerase
MNVSDRIVVTGAAGFIGSYLVGFLNNQGYHNLILVDDFSRQDKQQNLVGKRFIEKIEREQFFEWCTSHPKAFDAVFHLGARTDTTEMDYEVHRHWNLDYSKRVWSICANWGIPLVYASSAATYGAGEFGYVDDHSIVEKLQPLNPYGRSKNDFDAWAIQEENAPPFWAGVKFFNVFGPNEYHKGRMASVIFHAFNQIQKEGFVRLFKSHRPEYTDGGQLRDFIYVEDIVSICFWLMQNQPKSGLYNGGTGKARSFLDLANSIFTALGKDAKIQFIDTPADIRNTYQYFTESNTDKLRAAGYDLPFKDLETAVKDYVLNYLAPNKVY